jgi:molecular chaperone GrpE
MSDELLAGKSMKLRQAFEFAGELAAREKEHQEQMRGVLHAFLDVLDSCDRFFVGVEGIDAPTIEQSIAWLNSFRRIARQLERALEQAGVTPIACLGQEVDPERHEIVAVQDREDAAPDVILEVAVRGYEWNGQLLRRPRVVVARTLSEEANDSDRH